MANDIIGSMFGVDPNQIAMQNLQRAYQQNAQMASQDPLSGGLMANVGANIGMLGAKAMGLKTREEQIAENRQQIAQMIDKDEPDSYIKAAQRAQELGDTQAATALVQEAADLRKQKQAMSYQAAQENLAKARTEDIGSVKPDFQSNEYTVKGVPLSVDKLTGKRYLPNPKTGVMEEYTGIVDKKPSDASSSGMKPSDKLKYKMYHGKEYKAANSAINSSTDAASKITRILNNPNFGYVFGGYTEEAVSKLASGKISDIMGDVDSLKANLMKGGLDAVREGGGVGSMTEREWPIMAAQIASISPRMTEAKAREVMMNIDAYFRRAREESAQYYKDQWEEYPEFYKPDFLKKAATPSASSPASAPSGWSAKVKG